MLSQESDIKRATLNTAQVFHSRFLVIIITYFFGHVMIFIYKQYLKEKHALNNEFNCCNLSTISPLHLK